MRSEERPTRADLDELGDAGQSEEEVKGRRGADRGGQMLVTTITSTRRLRSRGDAEQIEGAKCSLPPLQAHGV